MCHHGALQWTGVPCRMYSSFILSILGIDSGFNSTLTRMKLLLKMNELRLPTSRLPTKVKHDDTAILASYQDRKILIVISGVDLLQQCGSNIILMCWFCLILLLFQLLTSMLTKTCLRIRRILCVCISEKSFFRLLCNSLWNESVFGCGLGQLAYMLLQIFKPCLSLFVQTSPSLVYSKQE